MSVFYEMKEHLVVRSRTEEAINDLEDVRNIAVGNLQTRMAALGALMLLDEACVFDLTLAADEKTYTFSGLAPNQDLKRVMAVMEAAKNLEVVFHYEFVWRAFNNLCEMAMPFSMADVFKEFSEKEMGDVFYSLWSKADCAEGEGILTAYGTKDGKYYAGPVEFVEATTLPDGTWNADTDAVITIEGHVEEETVKKVLPIVHRLRNLAEISDDEEPAYREFYLNNLCLKGPEDIQTLLQAYRELCEIPNVQCNLIGEYVDTTGADVQRMYIDLDENGELKITVAKIQGNREKAETKTSWVIPCNPKYYDVIGTFRRLKTVDWRQTAKAIEEGDTVYIYAGRPIQAITHKCVVLETNIPYDKVDDSDLDFDLSNDETEGLSPYSRYMRLQLVKEYAPQELSYAKLVDHGLVGSIQGQRRTGPYIQAAIDSVEPKKD